MVIWMQFRYFSAVAIGTTCGLSAYFYQHLRDSKSFVRNSWTNNAQPVNTNALWDNNWDFRDPKSLVKPIKNESIEEQNRFNAEIEKVRAKAVRHVVLIRHGEYLDIGNSDDTHHLTERGCRQAKYTGQRLNELGIKWHKMFVSTMTRAQETADIIVKEIKINEKSINHCNMLREGAPIPPQPPVGHWRPEAHQFFRDGSRIEAAFRRYFHRANSDQKEDTYTLIVGHGNVIRYFVCRALQLPPEAWLRMSINHASITWLTINPNGHVSIKYLGDTGFIPSPDLTHRIPRESRKCFS